MLFWVGNKIDFIFHFQDIRQSTGKPEKIIYEKDLKV